jgi:hypothetical protein
MVDRVTEVVIRDWQKSRASGTSNCVEVKVLRGGVSVRNSRKLEPELHFTSAEWNAFVIGVKAGEFDTPRAAQTAHC